MIRRPHIRIDGAVIGVTGASSGIGRATAIELATRGAHVVAVARNAKALTELGASAGPVGEIVPMPTDVSDADAVAATVDAAIARFGHLDAWINVAGVIAYGRYDEVPLGVHRQVIETNLLGAMHCTAAVLPHFRRNGHGSIVNVASVYGEITTPLSAAYATSKAALIAFSRSVRHDVKAYPGVEVSCVLPGSMDTPIFRQAANYTGRTPRAMPPTADPHRAVRAIVARLERPREVVRVGALAKLFVLAQRLFPKIYDMAVGPVMSTIGFSGEPAAATEGNVFEPAESWYQVDGEWRRTDLRAAAVMCASALGAGALARRRHTR